MEFAITVMHRPAAALGDTLLRIRGAKEEAFSILRDHPLTPDRVDRLAMASAAAAGPVLLDATAWRALLAICK